MYPFVATVQRGTFCVINFKRLRVVVLPTTSKIKYQREVKLLIARTRNAAAAGPDLRSGESGILFQADDRANGFGRIHLHCGGRFDGAEFVEWGREEDSVARKQRQRRSGSLLSKWNARGYLNFRNASSNGNVRRNFSNFLRQREYPINTAALP